MQSPASRRFKKAGFTALAGYFPIYCASFYVNYKLHPTGVGLWALALLPVIPILIVIVLMARYLRDEHDEYKRDLAVRCLLWGTAGSMAVNLCWDYLRIYGWKGEFPPFSGFWTFFIFMMAAKLTYRAQNKVPVGE